MDEPWRHYATWKKPEDKYCMILLMWGLWDHSNILLQAVCIFHHTLSTVGAGKPGSPSCISQSPTNPRWVCRRWFSEAWIIEGKSQHDSDGKLSIWHHSPDLPSHPHQRDYLRNPWMSTQLQGPTRYLLCPSLWDPNPEILLLTTQKMLILYVASGTQARNVFPSWLKIFQWIIFT